MHAGLYINFSLLEGKWEPLWSLALGVCKGQAEGTLCNFSSVLFKHLTPRVSYFKMSPCAILAMSLRVTSRVCLFMAPFKIKTKPHDLKIKHVRSQDCIMCHSHGESFFRFFLFFLQVWHKTFLSCDFLCICHEIRHRGPGQDISSPLPDRNTSLPMRLPRPAAATWWTFLPVQEWTEDLPRMSSPSMM